MLLSHRTQFNYVMKLLLMGHVTVTFRRWRNKTTLITDHCLAGDSHRVQVLLRPPTGHVIFEVRHVTHEAQTVFRRLLRTEQTLLNFHLCNYIQPPIEFTCLSKCICIYLFICH